MRRSWRDRLLSIYDGVTIGLSWGLVVGCLMLGVTRETYAATDLPSRVRPYTTGVDFDFVKWTFNAIGLKVRQTGVDEQAYLDEAARATLVRQYFDLQAKLDENEGAIARQYADPQVKDPSSATEDLRLEETNLRAQMDQLRPLAEALLQEQVSVILKEQGLVVGGQPFPPVAFHFTPLPLALIVSPRDTIRQMVNTDVDGNLTLEQQVALETNVAHGLDVSTLVVPLGGIGTYPAMVARSRDLYWIASVTAHEWTHNYLTLRPLGIRYDTTPELRTMNETTAETIGDEIGALVIQHYYPDLVPPPPAFDNVLPRLLPPETQTAKPGFDFRAEMHATRVQVDELLAAGKVDEAEAYMEQRRQIFWAHGYQIRKLNQAYFAFYGAYDVGGGGAGGIDPVGPAVRLLRRRSPTIAAFLNTMAGFTSFDQLQEYLGLK